MKASEYPKVGLPGWGTNLPAWLDHAACTDSQIDPEIFDPPSQEFYPPTYVREICERCPVKRQCLDAALSGNEFGIWGGLTRRQRDALKRYRVRVKCPGCGNMNLPRITDKVQACSGCGITWRTPKRQD